MDPDEISTLWMATYLGSTYYLCINWWGSPTGFWFWEHTPCPLTQPLYQTNSRHWPCSQQLTLLLMVKCMYCKQINTLDTLPIVFHMQLQFGRSRRLAAVQCNVVTPCKYSTRVVCLETATLNPSFRGLFHAAINGPILTEYHTTGRKKRELDDTYLLIS